MKKIILITASFAFLICCNSNQIKKETTIENVGKASLNRYQESLALELCTMFGLDQGIRFDSLEYNRREVMPKIDSLNFKRLVNFIKQNGFPNENSIGNRFTGHECVEAAAITIMLHNPHRLVNEKEYFDLFYEEVEKGNLPRSYFVDVLDKYYFMKSGWQHAMYGSQFGQPCITTKKQTNRLRKEVGLEPLKDEEFKSCE
ncbi:MAG: hypothetical protein R6V37_04160 [Psychroflexus maritimus]